MESLCMWLLNEMEQNLLSKELGQHGRILGLQGPQRIWRTLSDTSVTNSEREMEGHIILTHYVSLTGFGVAQFWGPFSASL